MKRTTSAQARSAIAAVLALVAVMVGPATPAAAAVHDRISGTGSSWSGNAINQWVADVAKQTLQIDWTANGSAAGRTAFAQKSTDFAVSDIGFRGTANGGNDTAQGRAFAYLPIVAGGTAFVYQVRVGGQLVRNLRLSGETLAKIFTGKITNWNDAQITADNNQHKLPSLPIIVIVHAEGSGSTAQFTSYLAKQYPSLWQEYNGKSDFTEFYPAKPANQSKFPGNLISPTGSDGVINAVTGGSFNGAIGYDEYSYALGAGFPVVKIENKAGYFTAPTDFNVAVALTKAQINMDSSKPETYLLQVLDQVYVNPDNRTYPLSSYSYLILPTGANDSRMTTGKRQTLVDFMAYSICTGQSSIGVTGYSPLPINLVNAGFEQLKKLKAADPGVILSEQPVNTCNNPTFIPGNPDGNHLADIAPRPADCDKRGAGPCGSGTTTNPGSNTGGGTSGSGTGGGGGAGGAGTNAGGAGTNAAGAGASAAAGAGTQIDPDTGQVVSGGGGGGGGGGDVNAVGVPNDLAAFKNGKHMTVLGPLAALLLVLVVVGPALLGGRLRRRRDRP